MKAGKEHRVPLAAAVVATLQKLPRIDGNPYVFPGMKAKKPLSNLAMTMTLRRLGRGDVTVHGFRSTFRDWAAERTHYPREVCEQALAHTLTNKAEAAYFRSDLFDKRRQMMSDWARYATSTPGKVLQGVFAEQA